MASPFPGMDPYLEGYRFHDFHNQLVAVSKRLLVPQIVPKYIPSIESYTVVDSDEGGIDIMYPDLGVFINDADKLEEPTAVYETKSLFTPPTIKVSFHDLLGLRIPYLEIRDNSENKLITVIEVLSPINKRKSGVEAYKKKCGRLRAAGVHLLEIDLLRRGDRPFNFAKVEKRHYMVRLLRGDSKETEIWAMDVKDPLPVVPVPLKPEDPDAVLDLGKAFNMVYSESMYDQLINYSETPPPPDFTKKEKEWLERQFAVSSGQ